MKKASPNFEYHVEGFLTRENRVVVKGARLRDLIPMRATLSGGWVPDGPLAKPQHVVRSRSFQLQVKSADNYFKCVHVTLRQRGRDVTAKVDWAGWMELDGNHEYGCNYPEDHYKHADVATADGQDGYGVMELELQVDVHGVVREEVVRRYLTMDEDVVLRNARLEYTRVSDAILGGSWADNHPHAQIECVSDEMSFQLQSRCSDCLKCVTVSMAQAGKDVTARIDGAAYADADYGHDFSSENCTHADVATKSDDPGYGVCKLTLLDIDAWLKQVKVSQEISDDGRRQIRVSMMAISSVDTTDIVVGLHWLHRDFSYGGWFLDKTPTTARCVGGELQVLFTPDEFMARVPEWESLLAPVVFFSPRKADYYRAWFKSECEDAVEYGWIVDLNSPAVSSRGEKQVPALSAILAKAGIDETLWRRYDFNAEDVIRHLKTDDFGFINTGSEVLKPDLVTNARRIQQNARFVQYKRRWPETVSNSTHYEIQKVSDDEIEIALHVEEATDRHYDSGLLREQLQIAIGDEGGLRLHGHSLSCVEKVDCRKFDCPAKAAEKAKELLAMLYSVVEPVLESFGHTVAHCRPAGESASGDGGRSCVTSDIFISYSRKDKSLVMPIVSEIERQTGVKPWIDLNGIETGSQFSPKITEAINRCKVFVFMVTPACLQSEFTQKEIAFARRKSKKICPLILTDAPLEDWFIFDYSTIDCIEYSDESQREKFFRNLVEWVGVQSGRDRDYERGVVEGRLEKARIELNDAEIELEKAQAESRARLERSAAELEKLTGEVEKLRTDYEARKKLCDEARVRNQNLMAVDEAMRENARFRIDRLKQTIASLEDELCTL